MKTSTFSFLLLVSSLFIFAASAAHATQRKAQHIRTLPPEPEIERQVAKYQNQYFLESLSDRKEVAITFDDGPSAYTLELLKILKRNDIKATFFWQGKNVEKYPDIARQALADGHTIANHTYSHPHSKTLDVDTFWNEEVGRTQAIIKDAVGFEPALFRPPFGEMNDEEIELLKQKGIYLIGWSIDPKDWSMSDNKDSSQQIVDVVNKHLHPGAIVLMHDGMYDFGINTVRAVERMIPMLKQKGYRFVTVDKLLELPIRLKH
jgi:peptidoglycan/xylan/chitin deacetylase (PgdA/CDA1 family)